MQLVKYNVVIDAASGTTTDNIALIDQVLHVGSALTTRQPVCRLLDIKNGSFKKIASAAESLRIQVVTVAGTANSTDYELEFEIFNLLTQEIQIITVPIRTPDTTSVTATTIGDQFAAAINANSQLHMTAVNAAGAITLTALTGYPVFSVRGTVYPAGGISIAAASPLGAPPKGRTPYYNLIFPGLVLGSGNYYNFAGSTAGYTQYYFEYYKPNVGSPGNALMECNIFINLDDADAAALVTAADAIFALATYNQEAFQVA